MAHLPNLTNGTKLNIEGHDYTVTDLREVATMYQDDNSYYGSKRSVMLTADGQGDRQDFSDAIEANNGDTAYIDGKLYHLIVLNLRASNGIMFVTDTTMNAIKNTLAVTAGV